MSSENCILFEHFVKLLCSISQVPPRPTTTKSPNRATNVKSKYLRLVERWFAEARRCYSALPADTCKIVFRLLFPEEDVRRRFNMKESTLARSLAADVFGLSTGGHGAGRALLEWSDHPDMAVDGTAKLGCLGVEVEKVLSKRYSEVRQAPSPSIQMIDRWLDELASLSGFSKLDAPPPPSGRRPRAAILRDLFLNLDPTEAKYLTQIILKDLHPVLYPLAETNSTRALLHYNSHAVHVLTKWEVMKAWNPHMPKVYRARAILDDAANAVERLQFTNNVSKGHEAFSPVVGIPIEIPKCQKGVKLSHALNFFSNQGDVWAETKYDGERMQIHIDLRLPPSRQITIFSKSKRDSTLDRIGTHPIIRAALGLPPLPEDHVLYPALGNAGSGNSVCPVLTSVILDAEMVCYSESKGDIDEFWRLRSLIENTALGVRRTRRKVVDPDHDSQESRETVLDGGTNAVAESLQSNASDNGDRHFQLIFFDILSLNGFSLLDHDYVSRRAQLEKLFKKIPGYASLSSRQLVRMSGGQGVKILAKVFSEHIANFQEGLVLKAAKSPYNDNKLPWVKLKRDYIPGYGDTVDLVVIGAGWNKDRARELRVSPETFTTLFIAALEKHVSAGNLRHCFPQFQVLFAAEYGMDREQLETLNFYLKTSDLHPFCEKMTGLPYTYKLPNHSPKPAVMFSQPLLVELFGSGFTKEPGAKHYSLRFPRIAKVWWPNERNWAEGSLLEEYQDIARLSIGHESSDAWANRTVEALWGCDTDAGPKDPQKIARNSREWCEKLINLEKPTGDEAESSTVTQIGQSTILQRKAPMTNTIGPPTKRRRLQGESAQNKPLKALGSVTNFMNTDTGPQNEKLPDTKSRLTDHDTQRMYRIDTRVSCARSMTSEGKREPRDKSGISDLMKSPSSSGHDAGTPGLDNSTLQQALSVDNKDFSIEREKDLTQCWPQKYIHTPVVQFLQDSYVWIPRGEGNKRPSDRPPAIDLVPQNRRVGVIYMLLVICGCRFSNIQRSTDQFAHVNKCVIFVDTGQDAEARRGLERLFRSLDFWREDLNKPCRKELFVLDSGMITYSSLATFNGDVKSLALWRSGGL